MIITAFLLVAARRVSASPFTVDGSAICESGGLVGIGTTSPAQPLTVYGNTAYGQINIIGNGTNAETDIGFKSSNVSYGSAGNWLTGVNIGNSSGDFSIWNAGTNDFYIKQSNGNVGIGTTSPVEPVHVHLGAGKNVGFFNNTLPAVGSFNDDFSAWGDLQVGNNLFSMANGKVGIGTTSPAGALDVTGSALPMLTVRANASAPFGAFFDINATAITGGKNWRVFSSGGSAGEGNGKLIFQDATDGVDAMTLLSSGYVGIGTTSPGYALSVKTGNTTTGITHTDGTVTLGTYVNDADGGQFGTVSNHPMGFYTDNASPQLWLATGGNVGIGTASPAYALSVSGGISQTVTGQCTLGVVTNSAGEFSACYSSDRRVKNNIATLNYSSTTIDALRPVYYVWIDTVTRDAQQHIGFIAQEVQAVMPQAVSVAGKIIIPSTYTYTIVSDKSGSVSTVAGPTGDGGPLYGVDPNAMIALLVKEVQVLRVRVAALETK